MNLVMDMEGMESESPPVSIEDRTVVALLIEDWIVLTTCRK